MNSRYNRFSWGGLHQRVYVLKWNCGHCWTYASFADGRCLNCANPFDSQEVDKISDKNFEEVSDSETKYKVLEMMGWFCSSCTSYNRNLSRKDHDMWNIDCNCESCGNELNVDEDGDYILKDGPSASTPAWAVRAMIERNIAIMRQIQARKAWRILVWDTPTLRVDKRVPRVSSSVHSIWKSHRNTVLRELEQKYPKWYWWLGAWSVLLAWFLAYKWFEEKDVTIHIDSFSWARNISLESVQRLNKSDWAEDLDKSNYQTDAFYQFLERNRYFRQTHREYNHNPNYCYTTPESETYIDYRQECTTQTSYSQSCTATSWWWVSCSQVPSTTQICQSIPEPKTRYYDQEHCEYVQFDINDWAPWRNLLTSWENQNNPPPYWQEYALQGNGYSLWSEREAWRKESYRVHVSYNNGEDFDTLQVPQGIWEILSVTSECSARASFILWVNIDTIEWDNCSN